MTYLTFRPTKGSLFIPRLVRGLSYAFDVVLLLLMAWNIANTFYPIWGWTNFTSLWIGLIVHPFIFWLVERFRLRAAIVPKFKPIGPEPEDHDEHIVHFGFVHSVWKRSGTLSLAGYSEYDGYICPRKRTAYCLYRGDCSAFHVWSIVLLFNALPIVVLIGLASAGYFLGVGVLIFFSMGLILVLQLQTLYFRLLTSDLHLSNKVLLGETIRTPNYLGLMTCILEGPDGELFFTLAKVVEFDNRVRYFWLSPPSGTACNCCPSVSPFPSACCLAKDGCGFHTIK